MRFVKLTWPTGALLVDREESLLRDLPGMIAESEIGEEWKLEVIEMSEKEFADLPEFDGP